MDDSPNSSKLSTFRFRKRTPGTFVLVPFPKQGRSIRCQGQLEAAAARVLAACPLVKTLEEQPLAIYYSWSEESDEITLLDGPPSKEFRKDRRCSYVVPDLLVSFDDGRNRLVEIKPSHKRGRPLIERKLRVARCFAEAQGWTYHVVTERHLFSGPLSANVRLLARFRQLRVDPVLTERIQQLVADEPLRLAEIVRHNEAIEPSMVRAAVWHLVVVERLSTDITQEPLSDSTMLYPERRCVWDPFVSVWEPSGSTTNGSTASCANSIPTRSSPKS